MLNFDSVSEVVFIRYWPFNIYDVVIIEHDKSIDYFKLYFSFPHFPWYYKTELPVLYRISNRTNVDSVFKKYGLKVKYKNNPFNILMN